MGSWFRDRRPSPRAVTAVELLVAAAVSLILLAALFRMMMSGFKQQGIGERRTAGLKEAALVATCLREDLAGAILPPGTAPEDFIRWDGGSARMRFSSLLDGKTRIVEYRRAGTDIIRVVTDPAAGKTIKRTSITVPGLRHFGPPEDTPLVGSDSITPAGGPETYKRVFVRFRVEVANKRVANDNEKGRVIETMMYPLDINRKAWKTW